MKLILWLTICAVVGLTAVEANRHRSQQDLTATSPRTRKPKGSRPAKKSSHSKSRSGNVLDQLNETGARQKQYLNSTEVNKQIQVILKKYTNMTSKQLDNGHKPKKEIGCHSVAMVQCGCESLRLFEESRKKNPFISVPLKCEIRQKFFDCLSNLSKVDCKRKDLKMLAKHSGAYEKQKKEIVRVLWTARECLLGQVSQRMETEVNNTSELNFNFKSSFCKKVLRGTKGGKHKKGHSNPKSKGRKVG
ncbi:hypothetical protein CHUAL_012614 [Chamberlinius hualienensis]